MVRRLCFASLLLFVFACSDSGSGGGSTPTGPVSAEIRRTEYGIPHVKADDWASLGYGFGYAYAQDNFCVTMREIVFAIGRSAELMGEEMGSTDSDFLFTYLNGDKEAFRREFVEALPQYAQDLGAGFTRGMNRYLRDTGLENLPEGDFGCRNAEWVFEFDEVDLALFLRREALRGSSDNGIFRSAILATEGPTMASMAALTAKEKSVGADALRELAEALRAESGGSNGLALGSEATQS
jgi:acyl-homoserine-lactone acylase